MSERFKDKVVVVTGAGRGLGLEAAKAFAAQGAIVALAELNEESGRKAEAQVKAISPRSRFVQVDVSSSASVERAFQEIDSQFGRIDFAVNNAALIYGEKARITEMSIDRFMKSMGVNAGGVLLCMQHELRSMLKRKSGVIVNIASISAHHGYPGMVDYCASKHAIIGLTKTAALEVAREGVRVAAVSPGAINTAVLRSTQGDEYMKTVSSPIPLGRIAEPAEIVAGIFFLVSDEAAQFVGHTLHLDGGMNDVPPIWW